MTARIYQPTRSAMQAVQSRDDWLLEYEPEKPREIEPLMGWTSSADMSSQVQLRFDTLEEAVAFAKKHGLEYTLIEPQARTPKTKSYADNFRYDRVRT